MSEMIVRLKEHRVKIKGCEYVRDLIRCGECAKKKEPCSIYVALGSDDNAYCSQCEEE